MRHWPPLGKFLLVLALLIASLLATSIVVPLLAAVIGFLLLFRSTHFRFPRIIVIAFLDAFLVFLVGVTVIALVTPGSSAVVIDLGLAKLIFSDPGLHLAAMVLARAVAGALVMLFFATSTPIPHFARALRQIKVPKYIVELVILVYRYAFLLLEQLDVMYDAAQARVGFRGLRNKVRTTGKLMVGLFIRSLEVGERSQIALQCRNFRGEFHAFRPPPRMNLAWAALPFLAFAALYALNLLLEHPLPGWW